MPFRNFSKYKNPIFIETGTYLGDGVQAALDLGFDRIISFEVSDKYYNLSRNRFQYNSRVSIHNLDSGFMLLPVIKEINIPITFWLDGHWSMDDTGYGNNKFPLLDELNQIIQHPIKSHTIIIDDVRLFNTQFGTSLDEVKAILKTINNSYNFTLENGYIENDVLVARI